MSASPTAFVAGATGYVGRALVATLVERGARVVAHVRPDSPRLAEWRERFATLGAGPDATAWEGSALAATLARIVPTHVFALVGTTARRARVEGLGKERYETVDHGLTRMLLEACTDLEPPPRFVYVSSLGAGPPRAGRDARQGYLAARWRTEEAVRASGLPYTIARPPIITGPDRDGRRPLERLSGALMGAVARTGGLLGAVRFRDRYRPIDARELANGLVHAAFNYTTIDRVVEAEELRYSTAVDRDFHIPVSRRDAWRH